VEHSDKVECEAINIEQLVANNFYIVKYN